MLQYGKGIGTHLKGPDLPRLITLGRQIYGMTAAAIPGAQIRPIPGLDLGNPELRITPNRDRLTRLGISTTDLGGTADQLTRTRDALIWNLILAVAICYLLMSALFENFLYPLIILFSVPLAAAGGFLGIFWSTDS